MLLNISEIKINEGRRALASEGIKKLAESIANVGLLNPITVNEDNTLIAGYHRLEAAKKLGWTEIECSVRKLENLEAELAEIDENIVRTQLTTTEEGNLLLRRKEIYETLHPETKHGMRNGQTSKDCNLQSLDAKPFVQDAAEKLGVSQSTVSRKVQAAKNTTQEAKEIILENGIDLSQQDALKLSRMEPEQQKEAAEQLASQEIQSVSEYRQAVERTDQPDEAVSETAAGNESAKKNPQSCTGGNDGLFLEIMDFADTILEGLRLYDTAPERFTKLSSEQITGLENRADEVCNALLSLIDKIKDSIQ